MERSDGFVPLEIRKLTNHHKEKAMSICKIGETKVINGKRCRKDASDTDGSCNGCHFFKNGGCPSGNTGVSIEDGGSECDGAIWRLADDQTEAPTDTPPRDELREQRRFQAAVAAMQGLCANRDLDLESASLVSRWAVEHADALLAELDRTGEGK
jgi:hypothetical protein